MASPLAPLAAWRTWWWHLRDALWWPLLLALGPVCWWQGRRVRARVPTLDAPAGLHCGQAGVGPVLRVLIAGDSAALGLGVRHQSQALSGQLVQRLAQHHTVYWTLWAESGWTTADLVQRLQEAQGQRFDVVVLSLGVNDVTRLRAPAAWLQHQQQVAATIRQRCAPTLLIHTALPPLHRFEVLPQPLRWVLGRWAQRFNHGLAHLLAGRQDWVLHEVAAPEQARMAQYVAADGFHPGAQAYALWADSLAQRILRRSWPQRSDDVRPVPH